MSLVWKNVTQHTARISAPSNTFGMNYNRHWRPGLLIQHPVPDLIKALLDELANIHTNTLKNLVEIFPEECELLQRQSGHWPLDLERDVVKAPVGVMGRWPNTCVCVVYGYFPSYLHKYVH